MDNNKTKVASDAAESGAKTSKRLKIYYIVLAIVMAAALITGIVNTTASGGVRGATDAVEIIKNLDYLHPVNTSAHDTAKDYIVSYLRNTAGITEADATEVTTGDITKIDAKSNGTSPVFTVAEVIVDGANRNEIYTQLGLSSTGLPYFIPYKTINVIVYLPGEDNSRTGLAICSYDSLLMSAYEKTSTSVNASDMIPAAAMLNYISNNKGADRKNGMLFVFSDAEHYGYLGAYAIRSKFIGFDRAAEKVKLAAGFYAAGASGTVMYTSNISGYNPAGASLGSDMYKDTHGVQLFPAYAAHTNYGGSDVFRTAADTVDNIDKGLIGQYYSAVGAFDAFAAGADMTAFMKDNSSDVKTGSYYKFSFFKLFTLSFTDTTAYVFGSVLAALLLISIVLMVIKKVNITNLIAGAAVAGLSAAAAWGFGYVVYYTVGWLLTITGALPGGILAAFTKYSIWTLLSMGIFSIAGYIGLNIVFKRIFRINAHSVVRGNALLIAVIAIIMSFVNPKLSFIASIISILELLAVIAVLVFSKKFNDKHFPMEKLFLYVWPLILAVPFSLVPILLYAQQFGAAVYPFIMLLLGAALGFIAPYFNYLTPSLKAAFAKITRPVRIERIEEVRQEDKAKKGKFTTVKKKVVRTEKRPLKYSNLAGVVCIALVGFIFTTSFFAINSGFIYKQSKLEDINLKDSLVYVINKQSGALTNYWMVQDLNAFNYYGEAIKDFEWNDAENAYVLNDDVDRAKANGFNATVSNITSSGKVKTFSINQFQLSSRYTITLPSTSDISEIKFTGDYYGEPIDYTFKNSSAAGTLSFELKGNITMAITSKNSLYTGSISYVENVYDYETIESMGFTVWQDFFKKYTAGTDAQTYAKGAVILKLQLSV